MTGANQYRWIVRPPMSAHGDLLSQADYSVMYTADQDTVRARDTLLRVLPYLKPHMRALTVVGSQAVMERTEHLRHAAISPVMTKDGDIVVDPALVAQGQSIVDAMEAAGFQQYDENNPGIYSRQPGTKPSVDLLVPEAVAGSGTRSARLGTRREWAAGRAKGLELALLDADIMELRSLRADGPPAIQVRVAGCAALLCAKAYKLGERVFKAQVGHRDRVRPKDATDMYRLMQASDPTQIADTFQRYHDHLQYGAAIRQGEQYILSLFAADGTGTALVAGRAGDPNTTRQQISDWIAHFTAAISYNTQSAEPEL